MIHIFDDVVLENAIESKGLAVQALVRSLELVIHNLFRAQHHRS